MQAVVALTLVAGASAQQKEPAASEEIRGMIAKYAKSIDDADTALAAQIWSNSPGVSFIHPLGHEHGFDEVKRNVYERIMGGMLTDRKLNVRDAVIQVYGDAAWVEFNWEFTAKMKQDGAPMTTKGRETQIYRKEARGWRLVHVHYSATPATSN